MARRRELHDLDRHLQNRRGTWQYKRHVPYDVAHLDDRSPQVRLSLKTSDLAVARLKRDMLETADNEFWAALLQGHNQSSAKRRYEVAVQRAAALGFKYRSAADIGAQEPLLDILMRIEAAQAIRQREALDDAVLGAVDTPPIKVSEAFEIYESEIVAPELRGKSDQQKRKWRNAKKRGIDLFIELRGDLAMKDITREDGLAFYRHWLARIAPKEGRATHTASSGNRDLGAMRTLFSAYFSHMGERDRDNPFAGLSFSEVVKVTRPSVPAEFIRTTIFKPGALDGMGAELRGILLATVDTGCRPSETCNLDASMIRLDHAIPHLAIAPRLDPDNPRELKTGTSARIVPLIGVALAVFRKHPTGFPAYREREEAASAALNKFLRENGLMPSPKHTLYSFRHAFEDRMKDAGLGDELRRILMGHQIGRERYGEGGSLEWRQSELQKIALEFDSSIV